MTSEIKIGISACLLGQKVRLDGGHKHDRYITHTLGRYFSFVPVCPETECGMGIPREAMRLVGEGKQLRLVTSKGGTDRTEQMQSWMNGRLDALAKENLCGFIFKKGSPSSGLYRVKIYNRNGQPVKYGRGIFANAFTSRFPRIPVEEEGRLHDPVLRENFVEQVFTLKRWRDALKGKRSVGNLVDFHTREKLLLMAHSPKHYRQMGRLVAEGKQIEASFLYEHYETLLMEALALKATAAKNTNVLMHILGYFRSSLSAEDKQTVRELIENYHKGILPLIVPITLLNYFVHKYRQPYLSRQTYLNPHPLDLRLRNHV